MAHSSVVLFCGPSLPPNEARRYLPHAKVEPPARCGDIYRAAMRGATVVGLVDGYFDHTLSVWHKEVLWALSQGVRVYGAASMGALRAAELAEFGMIGVGTIYEQFHSGELLDDDEVAVVHEPAENGYRAQCDAMVNIRATLSAATAEGVVTTSQAQTLIRIAKGSFYPLRNVRQLVANAQASIGHAEAKKLDLWLSTRGAVNQKQIDALEMLERIAADLAAGLPASACSFVFEDTDAWRTLKSKLDRELEASSPATTRHAPSARGATGGISYATHTRAQLLAAARALARILAEGEQASVDLTEAQMESEKFRKERGLISAEQTQKWLTDGNLDVAAFSVLIHDSVLYKRYETRVEELILSQLPSALMILGIAGLQLDDQQ